MAGTVRHGRRHGISAEVPVLGDDGDHRGQPEGILVTVKRTWSRWGIEWDHRGKRIDLFGSIDLRNMNGPHWVGSWYEPTEYMTSLMWGCGGDPVWSVSVLWRLPPWFMQWCERRWERKK
jgi:hypothetical protein